MPAVTLPGELGFYALLPIYAAFFTALRKGPLRSRWLRNEFLLLGGLAGVSIVFRVWSTVHEPPLAYVFYGVPGIFLWAALGMGMAAASVALEGREDDSRAARLITAHPWPCWLAGAAIYLALSRAYPTPILALLTTDRLHVVLEYVGVGASAALFMAVAVFGEGAGGGPRRILATPALSWIGVISYGLYLYHVPIQVKLLELGVPDLLPHGAPVTLTALSLVLTILCAAVSYYAFERPILRLKESRRARRSSAARPGRA